MKRRASLITILCLGVLFATIHSASADDTEIYTVSSSPVKPNVLILFDNNASMANNANAGDPYNPGITYTCKDSGGNPVACPYVADQIYRLVTTNQASSGYTPMTGLTLSGTTPSCVQARTGLADTGTWSAPQGSGLKTNGTCGTGGQGVVYLGNLLNYNSQAGSGGTQSEANVINQAVRNVVNATFQTVNYGLEVFNINKSGGYMVAPIQDLTNATTRTTFLNRIPDSPQTGTSWPLLAGNGRPLAEALYDAGAYYKGVGPIIGGGSSYSTPITDECQKNFVIILANGTTDGDGSPKLGQTTALGLVGDFNHDGLEPGAYGTGTHYLDDVAGFIHDNLTVTGFASTRGVKTFVIQVFSENDALLIDTARLGHGEYYTASNANAVSDALTRAITQVILEANSSFVAPVVPVSPANRTFSGDKVYIGFFRPLDDSFWFGNLKKYAIRDGIIVDKNGNPATDSTGAFLPTAQSYWSANPDGGEVTDGGIGQLLLNRTSARNLYTYLGSNSNLNHASNAFNTTNITPTMLGLSSTDTTSRTRLVNFVYGYDTYGPDPTAKRDWIMGDILHSRPVVVNYTASLSMIYVGSNGGMLHAFEDNFGTNSATDGQEKWGFIPRDVLPNLQNMVGAVHGYFVDGSPSIYLNDANNDGQITTGGSGDQAILVFGERRGGNTLWALDVTDPNSPVFKWKIDPTTTGFSELGQSWSQPQIGKMNIGGTIKPVVLIGGGYDDISEDELPPTADTKGRAIYVIDLTTGAKIWDYSYTTSVTNDSSSTTDDMTYSVPSDLTPLDTANVGLIDRIYVGDLGGRMWRFNVGDPDTANWTGGIIFKSNPGNDSSTGRKIFYPPDVTFEIGYQFLFFGTGDREHPITSTSVVDRIYAVRDYSVSGFTTEGNSSAAASNQLMDVTVNLLQDPSSTSGTISSITASLAANGGWYIRLIAQTGEKALSPAVVVNKVATFTTYAPLEISSDSNCTANLGSGYVYSLAYQNGNSVYDYNGDDSVGLNDRAKRLGSGIPSGVVVVVTNDDLVGLVGIGGGINPVPVPSITSTRKIYWRQANF
jgi:type IV pilus assembly protein PilY1